MECRKKSDTLFWYTREILFSPSAKKSDWSKAVLRKIKYFFLGRRGDTKNACNFSLCVDFSYPLFVLFFGTFEKKGPTSAMCVACVWGCDAYRCFLSASLYTYLMHPGWILCVHAPLLSLTHSLGLKQIIYSHTHGSLLARRRPNDFLREVLAPLVYIYFFVDAAAK